MVDAPRPALDIVYAAERQPATWESRHAAGEVPSRWLYGLDELGVYADVHSVTVAAPDRLRRALSRLPLSRGPRGAARDRYALAWDENAARRMLVAGPRDGHAYSGLIWLTDQLSRLAPADIARAVAPLRGLEGVFVLSTGQLEEAEKLLGPGGPRVGYVPFGIDADFYVPVAYPERPVVFSVGGDRDRDTATLFAALEAVHAAVPEAELHVQTSNAVTAPDGITVHADFSHRELRAQYARASVVAIATHPNLHVSGMTVSLEAMATGRPVVLTRSPGADGYIADGETGYLVPQRAPEALADAVIGILRDPDEGARLGAAGRRAVEAEFTTARLASRLAEFMRLT